MFESQIHDAFIIAGIVVGLTLIGYGLRRLIDATIVKFAQRTQTRVDDILVNTLRIPIVLWFTLLGLMISVNMVELSPVVKKAMTDMAIVLLTFSTLLVISKLAVLFVRVYEGRIGVIKQVGGTLKLVIQILAWFIGIMFILGYFGISITPLLASIGIAGLVVAFALQETLSNFFAGIYIWTDKPVRIGDFIRLESGEEGKVIHIGWRSTRIKTLTDNVVIIPNKKLAESIITNYNLPEKKLYTSVDVGVSYDSDPERVEKVLREVVEEVSRSTGRVAGEPVVRFVGFGDFSLNFKVLCPVKEYADQYAVQHEIRKKIFERFRREGITIPFPIRTVYLTK